jgi:F0F1-type ATP synthase membrane subunit b/b'
LYYFNKKSIHFGDFLKNRRAKFEKEVEEATREREESERRYQELTTKKENLEKEIITLKNQAMAQMDVQKKALEENATAMSERIKKEAGIIAEAEIARIRKEIREEIIELATKKAIELIKEKFSDADQERIEKEFISEIKKRSIV